jgi:hypothetical protein
MGPPFSVIEWLQLLAFGGLAGALGQGARTVIGFKKLNDATSGGGDKTVGDLIEPQRLIVPLVIGFIAGALAAATTVQDLGKISLQQVLALAAAGYAGADFLEGIISRIKPAPGVPAGQEGVGTGGGTGEQILGTVG